VSSVGRSIAHGAIWMVALNILASAIGVLSTVILARLLLPADFGLIAMAMSFVAILELLWSFAFDAALIQNQHADRATYDTAWTMNVGLGVTVAAGLLLIAYPAAAFYDEPRLVPLISCLALGSVFQGFENIGVVAFRKELRFRSEFLYQVARKLAGFAVTIPLAFLLRDFWALAIGIVAGRIMTCALSYIAHVYRPRFSVAARSSLLQFSKWLFGNNLLYVLSMRSQDFVIGKIAGPAALGLYTLSYEIAMLPATNLVQPINRAVFPGFAKLSDDRPALQSGYLQVLGMIGLIAAPAGLGIAAISEWLVPLALGSRWLDAIPVVKILAIYGVLAALSSAFGPAFMALGRPQVLAKLSLVNLMLFIPAVVTGARHAGVLGAAWGCLTVVSIMLPLSHTLAAHALGISVLRAVSAMWRPVTAAVAMYFAVSSVVRGVAFSESGIAAQITWLAGCVALGVLVYLAALSALWMLARRPDGAERSALRLLSSAAGAALKRAQA
jgi:O-antigen/teichoic acid export membrane protein